MTICFGEQRCLINASYWLYSFIFTIDPMEWRKIRLEVYNEEKLTPTYNVIGFIRGAVEPDRYVIYGNHRDGMYKHI